jgi:hypothetical protein
LTLLWRCSGAALALKSLMLHPTCPSLEKSGLIFKNSLIKKKAGEIWTAIINCQTAAHAAVAASYSMESAPVLSSSFQGAKTPGAKKKTKKNVQPSPLPSTSKINIVAENILWQQRIAVKRDSATRAFEALLLHTPLLQTLDFTIPTLSLALSPSPD